MIEPVVLVHGGAGDIPDSRVEPKLVGVRKAAKKGYEILKNGGRVIDAVQAAVQVMEDDEAFNAGYGSVLNTDGEVEMDAIIMEGTQMKAGSVGALKNVAHPIDVARLVMEKTPHVLLVGEGAKRFANEQGIPHVPTDQLISEFAKQSLKNIKYGGSVTTELGGGGVGTVGAVAIDEEGHVAVATSTGGISGKMVGRVGDTPLPGCGGFADDKVGAISTTGHGESIMRFCLAHDILTLMKQGKSATEATKEGCLAMTQRIGNTAGAITISCRGEIGISFTSRRMAWAYQRGSKLCSGIEKHQELFENVPASDDEDDDLEALRLAALQTLGSKPSSVNTNHIINTVKQTVLHPAGPGRGFRGGLARMHSGRNVFQRHRQNSNLIAIVPVSNEPSPGSDSTQNLIGRGQVDSGVRLELPQDRYCKVEISKDDKLDVPVVSTKFNRYDDSDSDSSAEESAGEDSSDKISASGAEEEDCDVLTVAEDSLDKLMNELEEEMNRSDTNVPVSSSVKPNPEPQKRTKNLVSKSKHNTCDSKNQKSQVGISTSKVVPVSFNSVKKKTKESYNSTVDHRSDLSQLQSLSPNRISVTSYSSNPPKNISDKDRSTSGVSQNCILSHKTDTNSQRLFSSNLSRKSRPRPKSQVRSRSRSRSQHNNVAPLKKIRRSRSSSPKGRYSYSPIRSQMPRSPRSRLSRSPVPRGRLSRSPLPRGRLSRSPLPRSRLSRSPVRLARSRSRSPLRSLRSPQRKRYSRSPPWHSPTNSHLSRFSPRRSSSRTRRPISPRRSPSPRVVRSSPQRSPQSRWWPSPRRSVSPRIRRSPSQLPRHLSPRSRRSSVSPRRPLSPIRRRLSPSPIRRNPSPLRRFSPRRNSPSVRYSRSVSRSPDRFVPRARSPANRSLHHGSPLSLKRRTSHSPSPRRRLSHSPFSRLPPRHSPVNRKLSPWSPPKQSVSQRISPISRRYSNSPGDRRRSQSPYGRQKRRSASPVRRQAVSRPPARSQRSPPRRPPQESRINNVRPRSRSPLPSRQHPDSNIHRSRSPTHARSPMKRSRSPTSSISLSPSPERGTLNNIHRYKSPLRLHASDYRNTIPSLHTSKENCRQRNLSPVQPMRDDSVSSVKPSKTKSGKRKEPRNKTRKRERSREDNKRESDRKSKENTIPERVATQESPPPKNDNENENMISDSKLAILEARKRKFESKGPVKPEAKKIRLKATQPSPPQEEEKQEEELEITPVLQELNDILKEEDETSAAITEKSASTLDNSETRDNMDFDLDEPVLELQSGELWSSEESDSDNEGRFKSSTRIHCSGSAKVNVLPFTKLLDEPKTSTQVDKTVSRRKKSVSRKSISEEVFKSKKASSKNKEDLKTSDEGNKTVKQLSDETQERMKIESKISNPSALTIEMESNLEYSAEGAADTEEELTVKSRECDLRAELSRRRAERLTKAGSLHESLPARLLQNAFEGVVGKKNIKRTETEEKKSSTKRTEAKREKTDGRRVLVLKRPAIAEQRIPSISVTIPKDNKRDLKADSPSAKLPIRMRLGLPSGGSLSEEHLVPRRRNRKVKLKRNVMIGSRPDDK